MQQRTVIIAVGLFLIIVGGMFVFAYIMRPGNTTTQEQPEPVATKTPYDSITRVDAKHFFEDGTHTLAGELLMPTPCDLLDARAVVRESDPEQVTLELKVINNSDSCVEQVTPARFMATFEASEDAKINATLNGRAIDLNLIPPAPGETPADFELYIKG